METDKQLNEIAKKVAFNELMIKKRMVFITLIYQSQLFNKPLNSEYIFENSAFSDSQMKVIELLEKNIPTIQKIIQFYLLDNWTWDRIPALARAILIYGVFEMRKNDPKIVIDTMINIAKIYNVNYKFVNAILDKINKDDKK
ncbi:transcription antitermination factor NusB [Mycoplasma sp. 128]|uniref:transcription antitermination factor NusB n=1 Tax=Mycoplasma sp. 3341 TaxID=3447506 RepID=UPI003F65DA9A